MFFIFDSCVSLALVQKIVWVNWWLNGLKFCVILIAHHTSLKQNYNNEWMAYACMLHLINRVFITLPTHAMCSSWVRCQSTVPTRANHHLQLFLSFVHFVFPCLEHFISSMVSWTYLTLVLGFDSHKAWYQRANDNLSLMLVFFPYNLSFQPLWARSVSWSDLNYNNVSFSFTHHQKSDMVIEKASDVYRK